MPAQKADHSDAKQTTSGSSAFRVSTPDVPRPTTLPPTVLRRRADFLAVAASGKKWVTQSFILQYGPLPVIDAATVGYGLTASSKVGNAVIRNRARRRLRALAHDTLAAHAAPGQAYIFIARAEATVTRDYKILQKDLLWALKKIGALRDAV